MRIGIDTTAMPRQRVGAGNYIFNLTRAVLAHDTQNDYVVFAKASDLPDLAIHSLRAMPIVSASDISLKRILWEQIRLPMLVRKLRLDVLHSPHYTMPWFAGCRSVVTFHDMIFFLYPELHTTYKTIFFRTMILVSLRRAQMIIADSESTRRDVLRLLHADPMKIVTVPLGVSSLYRPLDHSGAIRQTYHLPDKFILFVGVLEPRKNLTTLIRAFRLLRDRGCLHALVIVGRKGWMYADLFREVERLNLRDQVIFTGYVPEADLPGLFNAAEFFVYPSVYEGFGLPVLEAMACGTPVITSNVSSMPEIVDDAGVLIDPNNVEELAEQMFVLAANADKRIELRTKGLARARLFSWERTARETIAVYARVLEQQ